MLRKSILLLSSAVLSAFFLQCKPARSNQNNHEKEFEGIVTYHEINKTNDGIINVDDTVQLFYSHGNYVNIRSEKSGSYLIKDYFFTNESLRLMLYIASDTLRQLKLDFPAEKLVNFNQRKIKEKILSKNCEEIDLTSSYAEQDSTTYTDFKFVYSRGLLPVDKDHFKNWHLGSFDKFINASGAYYLKFSAVHFDSSHKNILSIHFYDVISIKEQPVDQKVFEINRAKIKWAK